MFTQDEVYRRWERHVEICEESGQEPDSFEEFVNNFYDLLN